MTPLLPRIEAAWRRSDELFNLIAKDALLDQPIPLRQPLLFYLGHLPAFAWNQIGAAALKLPAWNPEFDALFERGIDPIGVDEYRAADASQWPSERDVLDYRDRVRDVLRRAFEAHDARGGEEGAVRDVFPMVIEHELMHQETLLYMIQQLPHRKKVRPSGAPRAVFSGPKLRNEKRLVMGGPVTLGAPLQNPSFAWDNEMPERRAEVAPFLADELPVQNGDYLEFVMDGGYRARSLWDAESWAWRERRRMEHPLVWSREDGAYFYRSLFEDIPLAEAASLPVYVSLAEARAYAAWRGERLMTEPEHHRAAYGTPEGPERPYPWGAEPPSESHGNFDFRRFSPAPAGSSPKGASAWGIKELVGNGWEWTESPFEPFPGFEVTIPSYPGYSSDFFDKRHYVMLGASWATDATLVRKSFRNWFQPHYPYVFAKFRAVKPA
jgi:ergothioneine biosynthesis protein EgtB